MHNLCSMFLWPDEGAFPKRDRREEEASSNASGYSHSRPVEERGYGSQATTAASMKQSRNGQPANPPESPTIRGLVRHVETLATTSNGAPHTVFQPPADVPPRLLPLLGMRRGIQGHYNSCYMDATLFGMFVLCDLFDRLLVMELRPDARSKSLLSESSSSTSATPKTKRVPTLEERRAIQQLLREEIVNPLRKYAFKCEVMITMHSTVRVYGIWSTSTI